LRIKASNGAQQSGFSATGRSEKTYELALASFEAVAAGMGISVMGELEFPGADDRTVALKIDDPSLYITEHVACLKNRRHTRSIREFFRLALTCSGSVARL
jgi:DNA-binding transcriptional LysR family regulator